MLLFNWGVASSMKHLIRFGSYVAFVALSVAGALAGCSTFSSSNAPVDCNIVKTQAQAGKTNAQIAADLGAAESAVAACHGPERSGNKSFGGVPPAPSFYTGPGLPLIQ